MSSKPRGGSYLSCLRTARDLTQAKLGELSGIHATHISRIERGKTEPTLETLVALAAALQLEPDHLVRMAMPGSPKLAVEPSAGGPPTAGAKSRTLTVREAGGVTAPGQGTALPQFVVVIQRSREGYTASIPDLPGCTAAGATRQAAETGIRRIGSAHIQGMRRAGRPIPTPDSYAIAVEFDD